MPAALPIPFAGLADPVSSLSHLFGAVLFAALTVPLLQRAWRTSGDRTGRTLALLVFSGSAVLLLSLSAAFHSLQHGSAARAVLQRMDHAAIFVLIAGTFTPVHTILFRGPWRWGMLAFIWTVAVLGVTLKSIYFTRTPEALGVALYLGMGWMGLVSSALLLPRIGARAMLPLVLGGVVYTAGAAVELLSPAPLLPGVVRAHELFHLAVLAGLGLHWKFIYSVADRACPGVPPTEWAADAAEFVGASLAGGEPY